MKVSTKFHWNPVKSCQDIECKQNFDGWKDGQSPEQYSASVGDKKLFHKGAFLFLCCSVTVSIKTSSKMGPLRLD